MVLYKRKQVTITRPPDIPSDLSTEVYVIKETKEWFLNYEDYLTRMDYYSRRKFVCEITGNSCLTFFEALEIETREIKGVEKNFPEALREHILRFLQFNRITRLDQLIDKVYLVFRNDYFPGETIYIKSDNDSSNVTSKVASDDETDSPSITKQRGTIREKVQYGNSDNVTTKYLVARLNDLQQSIVTNDKISRDRNHFTKWLIKTFIKLTMSRSHKVGAPWVVKDKYAKKYRIPQEYPDDLKYYADSTPNGEPLFEDDPASKVQNVLVNNDSASSKIVSKKSKKPSNAANGTSASTATGSKKTQSKKKAVKKETNDSKSVGKSDKKLATASARAGGTIVMADLISKVPADRKTEFPVNYLPEVLRKEFQLDDNGAIDVNTVTPSVLTSLALLQPSKKNIVDDLEIKFDIQHPKVLPDVLQLPENSKSWNDHLVSEFKEDLDELDKHHEDKEENADEPTKQEARLEKLQRIQSLSSPQLASVQEALKSWIFINVYHKVLKIDTFTFDDFIYSMGWNLDQLNEMGRCELLDEIWCSVLSAILSNTPPTTQQAKNSKLNDEIFGLLITLPSKKSFIHKDSVDDDDEDRGSDTDQQGTLKSDDEESGNESGSELTVSKVDKNTKKEDEEEEEADDEEEDEDEDEEEGNDESEDEETTRKSSVHNAYTLVNYRNIPWYDRLRKRIFKDGNWQIILLGVLSMVEYVPSYRPTIEKVYRILAPKSLPATAATVLNQFYEELDIDLKFKTLNILIDLLANGSVVRNYIDECLETSASLRRTRLENIKDYKTNLDLTQKYNIQIQERVAKHAESGKQSTVTVIKENEPQAAAPLANKRYRLNLRVIEMNDDEKALAEKDNEFKENWEKRKDLLVKLELLRKDKRKVERELTELDCQRVKLLGKDRLFNRYWWFENNGLPTFFGCSSNDEDNDDESGEKDKENDSEDEDNDKDDVLDETYLMGRLWVQGPSDDDLRIYFNSSFEESELFNRKRSELEYESVSKEHHQDTNGDVTMEENGAQASEIKNEDTDAKLEDVNAPKIMNFEHFPKLYVDTVSELYGIKYKSQQIHRVSREGDELIIDSHGALRTNQLIQELGTFQRKAIEEGPDLLVNGTSWRYYENADQIEALISWLNPWGKRESGLRKELIAVKDVIVSTMEARSKALWKNKAPEEETNLEAEIARIEQRIGELAKDDHSEDEEIISSGNKRQLRRKATSGVSTPRKRQKLNSVSEILEFGEIDDLTKLKEKLNEELDEKRGGRDLQRVLEWVNSSALELYDRSLYDGGEKTKVKHNRGRPKKR